MTRLRTTLQNHGFQGITEKFPTTSTILFCYDFLCVLTTAALFCQKQCYDCVNSIEFLRNQTWLVVEIVWKFSMRIELTTNIDQ